MSVKFTSKGLADGTDSTKELEFNVAGVTTGTTRTITVPDADVDLGSVLLNNWTITESAGVLYFATSGTNKAKLDASGNFTVAGDITAYGTI